MRRSTRNWVDSVAVGLERRTDRDRELDQLQGEFDTLTRAKALAESDRERQSLASQLSRLEERMDELEEHLTPLARRGDELRSEIERRKARIEAAERAFAEGATYGSGGGSRRQGRAGGSSTVD